MARHRKMRAMYVDAKLTPEEAIALRELAERMERSVSEVAGLLVRRALVDMGEISEPDGA